jgi:hypothetical protein
METNCVSCEVGTEFQASIAPSPFSLPRRFRTAKTQGLDLRHVTSEVHTGIDAKTTRVFLRI